MRLSLLLLSLFQLAPPTAAPKHLTVVASTSVRGVAPGGTLSLYADVVPDPGIHVYAPGAADYLPVALEIAPQAGLSLGAKRNPKSEIMVFEGQRIPVYQKAFRLTQEVSVKRGAAARTLTINGTLTYQACTDLVCYLPAKAPLSWTVAVR